MADVPDMAGVLRQAMELQQQLLAAQEQANHQIVTGSAGGGVVRVEMTGGGNVNDVHIEPEAVSSGEVDLLEDLVLAAFRDAQEQVRRLQAASMGGVPGLSGLSGLPGVPGLADLPGLGAPGVDAPDTDD